MPPIHAKPAFHRQAAVPSKIPDFAQRRRPKIASSPDPVNLSETARISKGTKGAFSILCPDLAPSHPDQRDIILFEHGVGGHQGDPFR